MARSSNPKKLALWQGRFRRFLDSGLTVARFCAIEHVSESSFYYWQKKLGPQALRRPTRAEDHSTYAEHHGVRAEDCGARAAHHGASGEDRGTRAEDHDTRAEGHDACSESRDVFRPVTVVPTVCGVLVRLPGGTQIEVGTAHLDAIRAVVAETVRVDQSQATERNVSSDNQITPKASFDNQVARNVSSGNEVNRTVSSDNQVMRKRSGTVSC